MAGLIVAAVILAGLAPAHARYASVVIDAATGQPLHQRDADQQRHPASLTKLMTLYLVFEAIEAKRISFTTRWTVSVKAASQPPTKLGLEYFDYVTVRDVVLGLITRSANDAAVVAAEGLAGSVDRFAQQMTRKARDLGMTRTTFRNASGLPDPKQYTTARDMARLARAIIVDFPDYYPLFATSEFIFNGRVNANHNRLMGRYQGMDGLKTGYIRTSGFNLVASAVHGGRRLIGVVIGGPSPGQRDQEMARLLDAAFVATGGPAPQLRVAEPPAPLTAPPAIALAPPLVLKPPATVAAPIALPAPAPPTAPAAVVSMPPLVLKPPAAVAAPVALPVPAPPTATPAVALVPPPVLKPPSAAAAPVVLRPLAPPKPAADDDWGVQVGTFNRPEVAKYAAQQALKVATKALDGGDVEVVPAVQRKTKTYRARVVGVSQPQARAACKILGPRKDFDCIVLTPSNGKAPRLAATN